MAVQKVVLEEKDIPSPDDPETCFEDAISVAKNKEIEKNTYRTSSDYLIPIFIDIGYLFKSDPLMRKHKITQSIIQIACARSGIGFLMTKEELIDYKKEKESLRYSIIGQSKKFIDIIDNGKFEYRFKYNAVFRTPKNLFTDVSTSREIADISNTIGLPFSSVLIVTCLIGAYRLLSSREHDIIHRSNFDNIAEEIQHFLQVINWNKILKLKSEFYDAEFDEKDSTLRFIKLNINPKLTIMRNAEVEL